MLKLENKLEPAKSKKYITEGERKNSSQLISLASDSPLQYLNNDDILKSLSPQVMKRINRKKSQLMKDVGLILQKR